MERRPGDVHRLVRVVIEFQQVREQKGLCYSIYSYGTCHDNTGYFGVYTALGRETEGQALDTILAVIREPTEHGVTQAELDRAREQSKANVLMGLESAQSHMSRPGPGRGAGRGRHHRRPPRALGRAAFLFPPCLPLGEGAPEGRMRGELAILNQT
ncbi:MAG: insulinase family protein [Flavonifractor plautii]